MKLTRSHELNDKAGNAEWEISVFGVQILFSAPSFSFPSASLCVVLFFYS